MSLLHDNLVKRFFPELGDSSTLPQFRLEGRSRDADLEDGLKIGFIEFFIKLAIYYVHERIWQKVLFGQRVTKKRTLLKTLSWRLVATTSTFIIAGAVLDGFDKVALFVAQEEVGIVKS